MSVAVDAVSINSGGTQNPSWTHTPVGTPSAVGVGVAYRSVTLPNVTSITYGGVSMTVKVTQASGANAAATIWGLANPPPGPQTVQVNFDANPDRLSSMYAVTVTGSDLVTCFDTSNSGTGNSQNLSVVVPATTVDQVVMDAGEAEATASAVTTGGQTARMNDALNGGFAFGSTIQGSAGSTTMSWALGGSTTWGLVAAAFKVATGAVVALLGQACL